MTESRLRDLAARAGVATEYWGYDGEHVDVSDDTLRAVLHELGLPAATDADVERYIDDLDLLHWRTPLRPFTAVRAGEHMAVRVHVPSGTPASVAIRLENGAVGSWQPLEQVDNWDADREIDGRLIGEASFALPPDLPTGYHELRLEMIDATANGSLLVYPRRLSLDSRIGSDQVWGFGVQLYSVRSHTDWGIGDLATLTGLAAQSAGLGAEFVLVNPMHASVTRPPMESSPYSPSHRGFLNPLYIRPESVPEYSRLNGAQREEVQGIRSGVYDALPLDADIDRNSVWVAKIAALRSIHAAGRGPDRQAAYEEFATRAGVALDRFAAWSVIVEQHGTDCASWPDELRNADDAGVAALTAARADDVDFYRWLQWAASEQMAQARHGAEQAGMRIGIINDLAVGVGLGSAEVWSDPGLFARGMSVGAPPDHYNALGQDWGQTPWRPTVLAERRYEPFRRLVQRLVSDCDGLRIDHVMGLSRLWWVPTGHLPTEGTYVRYDAEAMIGVLLLEAERAGAILVGEDLGTVEPGFRELIGDRGVLGTSIVWFERQDDGWPRSPESYRRACMSSVTTHDLAPTAGYLRGGHVELRDRLGLLPHGAAPEWDDLRTDLDRWRTLLSDRGMMPAAGNDEELLLGLHRYLCATPSQLLAVALPDAVGDLQVQNQPGTSTEYRNWQVPLCDADGVPVALEDLFHHPCLHRLVEVMQHGTR